LIGKSWAQPTANLPKNAQDFLKVNKEKNFPCSVTLAKLAQHDLSKWWLERQDATLGMIGDDKQRFYIHFLSVRKSTENPNIYLVIGKTRVKDNICDFSGTIEFLEIHCLDEKERKENLAQAQKVKDEELAKRMSYPRGFLLAKYRFQEPEAQKGSGYFDGVMKTGFYQNKTGFKWDDLDFESDSYRNNEFVGTWTSYRTKVQKTCNWGWYRIPEDGDLDIGAGEFSPNSKYYLKGWENYSKYIRHDSEAIKKENEEWWR
jgi:hypothetical protein